MRRMTMNNETEFLKALGALRDRLERAFAPDTAASGFSGTSPSSGHCAAVSTIVNQVLGGSLVSAKVSGLSHWFNRVRVRGGDVDLDLTGDQFGFDAIQVAKAGTLYPDTRVRPFLDLNTETLGRARVLAGRSGLAEVVSTLEKAIEQRAAWRSAAP